MGAFKTQCRFGRIRVRAWSDVSVGDSVGIKFLVHGRAAASSESCDGGGAKNSCEEIVVSINMKTCSKKMANTCVLISDATQSHDRDT